VAMLAAVVALVVLSTASGALSLHSALHPRAVAFSDRLHGELGLRLGTLRRL